MDKDIFKNTKYNKISRNGILENDKYGIMKKFGFMSSFMSTTMQSKNKSFNEEKNKNETSNFTAFINKSFIKKNKSTSKQIIIKAKTINKINPIVKEDFLMKKCNNIFSYVQKMDFKTDKKKNKISKSFYKSYSLKKYSNKNQNSNNRTNDNIINESKSRIKSIIFNQLSMINHKNRKKIESYEKIMNKNYKLKYKFLFGKIKINENNSNKKNSESNTVSLSNEIDDNNMSTKREKHSKFVFKENKEIFFDNDSKTKECEIENHYNINNKYSSEYISDNYNNMNNFNIIEPCKNFNSIDENLCELDNDISEKGSNDNNADQNSNLVNNMNNNNFILFLNKEKERDIFDKYYLKKNFLFTKLSNLLKNNDSCNISPRNDFNDFSKINNHETPYEKNYKFISDIQKDTAKLPSLNLNGFLNLEDNEIYRLMGFMFDYSSMLIRANSLIKKRIKNCFYNIFSDVINSFSLTYSSFLKIVDYYFENRKLLINKKKVYTFNLVVISKVITKEINNSYDISYNYIANNKEYDNLWKIDIKTKNNIKLWLHTELFKMNNYSKNFTYSSQVSSFSYGDEIKFEINIFNQKQQLNPKSIQWLPPVITNNISNIFEANKFISNQIFDPLRCNELEIQTLIWEEVSNINNNTLLEEFTIIFKKNFKIKDIYTYTSKHIFYKIKIVANKIGIFTKNKYLFYDLNIIDYNEPLRNEIQPIYLMNSNYYNKKMDIRIGTVIIFYMTDYKS